jgi:hypothetical protein
MEFPKPKVNLAEIMRTDPACDFEGKDVIFGAIRMDRKLVSRFIYRAADLMDDGIPITHAFDYVVRCIREELLLRGEKRSEEEVRAAVQQMVFRDGVDL